MLKSNGDWRVQEVMLLCDPAGKLDRITILYGLRNREEYENNWFVFYYNIPTELYDRLKEFADEHNIQLVEDPAGLNTDLSTVGVSRAIRETRLFKELVDYIKEVA